ncbi:MAG: hypothetical protein QM754_09245 [Tepidisphaeraceae bacterium]
MQLRRDLGEISCGSCRLMWSSTNVPPIESPTPTTNARLMDGGTVSIGVGEALSPSVSTSSVVLPFRHGLANSSASLMLALRSVSPSRKRE